MLDYELLHYDTIDWFRRALDAPRPVPERRGVGAPTPPSPRILTVSALDMMLMQSNIIDYLLDIQT